jgi:hypothetical protein
VQSAQRLTELSPESWQFFEPGSPCHSLPTIAGTFEKISRKMNSLIKIDSVVNSQMKPHVPIKNLVSFAI